MIKTLRAMAAAMLAAAPAMAQTVDTARPATLVTALQTAGYKAVLDKDSSGDPRIKSAANGAGFVIYFYGCDKNVACRSIQFAAGYTLKDKPTPAKINDWNLKDRFAPAYLDKDGDPNIQWDVVLEGGMPAPLFGETLTRWTDAMAAFQTYIGW